MFSLAPDNRSQPDEVLLEDLRSVSLKLGKVSLTREEYAEHGRFAPATVANRFGGWGRAVESAGLSRSRHFAVTSDQALGDLKRVAAESGSTEVSWSHYERHGKFSQKLFVQHFGSWLNALNVAGLRPGQKYNARIGTEALFENLETVWQKLGRQPTVDDMFPPLSPFSAHVYKRRFGGWRKALEAFVEAASSDGFAAPQEKVARPVSDEPQIELLGRSRGVGWRLRYLVLKRDRFACRSCGRSPATHPGVVLQVDHVIPWSRGGLTVETNLQSLCEQCNGGKGDVSQVTPSK